jgi:hypothetical protein
VTLTKIKITQSISLRFEDITAVVMNSSAFWDKILSTYISEEHVTSVFRV